MHILILAQRVPFPPNKGEKIRTFHQLEYLKRRGHKISLLAPYEDESELEYFKQLDKQYCEHVYTQKLQPKFLSLPLGLLKSQPLSVANFHNKTLQIKFDLLIQEQQFDAIMCSASSMAEYIFSSAVINTIAKKPRLIMDFMDLDSDKWSQYADKSSFPMNLVYARENKLLSRYEKKIANEFEACFFITNSEVNLFKQSHAGFNNIYAIENGIDSNAFYPPEKPRELTPPTFLFAGVMDYPPNIDAVEWFMTHIWNDVLSKWPKAKFYIAGMNPTDKVQQFGNISGVEVTGFVEDIKPYFDQANIFIAPFRIARGVQNKILQAFACGLPVIATSMGAEGIRYTEDKDIVLADTPEDFIKKITLLVDDVNFYHSISKQALTNIEKTYSWDSILEPLETLFTSSNTQ